MLSNIMPVSGVLSLRRLSLVLFIAAAPHSASADIFKWQDRDGITQYSDRLPSEAARYQEIEDELPYINRLDVEFSPGDVKTQQNAKPAKSGKRKEAARESATTLSSAKRLHRRCSDYRERLDHIQSRLRAGYSASQGNRLRERRRDVSDRLYQECHDLK